MTLPSEVDVAVVGAGAAGLAAAKTVRAAGLSVAVLEAHGRIGGRALTDTTSLGVPWDRGAHWLHQARENPFTAIAERLGHAYRSEASPTRIWLDRRWADPAETAERQHAAERAQAALDAAAAQGQDMALAAALPDLGRWDGVHRQFLAAVTGEDPAATSLLDDARYRETGDNWPVVDGFGALVAAWGADVPVALNAPVRRIDRTGRRLGLETDRGTVSARAAILTPSTDVLASGAIAFEPALPADLLDALDGVPLGAANKVALAFDRDVFGIGPAHAVHQPRAPHGFHFQIQPCGRPIAVGNCGGSLARALEAAGPEAMVQLALDSLAEMFGTGVRRHLSASATTAWGTDPRIRGGYTVCRPGHADARLRLTQPVEERIFLAGEACAPEAFGTVGGAHASGVAAARRAVAVAGGQAPSGAPAG